MKKALITGVNGFCGQCLVRRLIYEGVENIYGIDINTESKKPISLTEFFQMDITEETRVSQLLKSIQPDYIFHLAGIHQGSPQKIYSVNVLGSIHLLENVRQFSPQTHVLLIGSAAEYGHVPLAELPVTEDHICNPYGSHAISKYAVTLAAREYVDNYGLKVIVARPFNIIGAGVPPSLLVGAILKRAKQALLDSGDPEIVVGNLDTERDFIAVDDAVDAYTRLLLNYHTAGVFNICSGTPRSVRSVVEELLSYAPRSIRLKVSPSLIRPNDVKIVYGSWEKINHTIGFKPQTILSDALRAAWDYEMESD